MSRLHVVKCGAKKTGIKHTWMPVFFALVVVGNQFCVR